MAKHDHERLEVSLPLGTKAAMASMAIERGLLVTTGCGRRGEPAYGELIIALFSEERERETKEPTLLQMTKEAPVAARTMALNALQIHAGNGEAARKTIGEAIGRRTPVSRKDWQTTVALLNLQGEIEERWPKMRVGAKE